MNDLQYYFLPTVCQSNHDNVRVIRKGCVQWTTLNLLFGLKEEEGLEPWAARQ